MYPGIHNYSEIGKLNKVLLHRIGEEVLRENGVEVIYYVDETAKALKDPAIKEEFLNKILDESHLNSEGVREAIFDYLIKMPEKDLTVFAETVWRTRLPEIRRRAE